MDVVDKEAIKLILPNQDITLNYWEEVNKFCLPLRQFGINFFNYLKVYNDGSIADLNNAPLMTEYFYYKSKLYQSFSPIADRVSFEQGFILGSSFSKQDIFNIMRDSFDIDNVIFFITKQKDATSFWQFGSNAGNKKIVNFYLNNIELLKIFVTYFKDQNEKLLKQCDANKYKIVSIDNKVQYFSDDSLYPYINDDVATIISQFKRYQTKSPHLTQRELECLKLCLKGKTAKEIAQIMDISYRTVESHIVNMKKKLSCKKLSQLTAKSADLF
jgi:DNA-binding CsgD family transcriptional regulator